MAPLTRFAPVLLPVLVAVAACNSVLGIEVLHDGPPPGGGASGDESGGLGGSSGTGGNHAPTGGAPAMPNGGTAGKGQSGGSSTAGRPTGDAGMAGMGQAGDGAGAGGTAPVDPTVHGHVIDYWGHAIAGIPIQIGDTQTLTDKQGAFTAENVGETYDVGLVVDISGDRRETYGWAFLGLTRRDPTLQVYAGVAKRGGNIQINPTNADLTAPHTLSVALGGPDGSAEFTELSGAIQTSTSWRGPSTTQEYAHALLWQVDTATSLPTGYLGYDSTLVALSDSSSTTQIGLDLHATATVPSGNLAGKVTPATGSDRGNSVFLRFTSGAMLELLTDTTGPNTFSYLVPTIANSGITFAAIEGDAYRGAYAVAHRDGLAAGATGLALSIPAPSKPLTPADGATAIDSNSQFTWAADAGNAGPFLVSMTDEDFYQGLYVVTAKKTFKVPAMPGGPYQFASAHKYIWRVETHGTFASIDAMAGETGFMDEFSGDDETPRGPRTGDGSFTISQSNEFTAK